jgi:hypothetical protein
LVDVVASLGCEIDTVLIHVEWTFFRNEVASKSSDHNVKYNTIAFIDDGKLACTSEYNSRASLQLVIERLFDSMREYSDNSGLLPNAKK